MTPLQLFRIWARRAPASDRTSAAVGAAIALALLVWLVIPVRHGDDASTALTTGTPTASGSVGETTPSVDSPAGSETAPTIGSGCRVSWPIHRRCV